MNFSKTRAYGNTRPAQTRIACVKNTHAPPELDILILGELQFESNNFMHCDSC